MGNWTQEIGQPCTATNLSCALHNLQHTIDANIKCIKVGKLRIKGRNPVKNNKINLHLSYGIYTASVSIGFPAKTMARSNYASF
jgi:hypothetical protein